jgi:hypothetical protein
MGLCTVDLNKRPCFHSLMKAELRISIKDYRQNKKLKVLLFRTPLATRRYYVRMNGVAGPKDRRAVSLTRLLTGVRKALVRAG